MASIAIRKNEIDYLIDEKVVALDIIMLLEKDYYNSMPYLRAPEYQYIDEVNSYFKDFHKEWNRYSFDQSYKIVMFDDNDSFAEMVDDFMHESAFDSFFKEHEAYFETVLTKNL